MVGLNLPTRELMCYCWGTINAIDFREWWSFHAHCSRLKKIPLGQFSALATKSNSYILSNFHSTTPIFCSMSKNLFYFILCFKLYRLKASAKRKTVLQTVLQEMLKNNQNKNAYLQSYLKKSETKIISEYLQIRNKANGYNKNWLWI